ncbi:MAG: restriction endonuclease [Nocardioides sp.]|uniref:hypothetical protein n=1 Tax=Nocardioides sp. TaxID=35761 RepID=UPI0039E22788
MLEELLASLIAGSGYRLLVDSKQDQDALTQKKNGLCVHGRGADHQVDVLGELIAPVQLIYPLRLFVEAKCRGSKTGLRDVRNAVGTVDDVNQYYNPALAQSWRRPYRRHAYRYALASTSGFSDEAVHYALTHELSLIDLSTDSARWLREAVERITQALLSRARQDGLTGFPVAQMREAMRKALGTWPLDTAARDADPEDSPHAATPRAATGLPPQGSGLDPDALAEICAGALDSIEGRMYPAWTNTPFLLFLLPEDGSEAGDVLEVTATSQEVPVRSSLQFIGRSLADGGWALEPTEPGTASGGTGGRARLFFTVPPQMEPYLFGELHREGSPTAGRGIASDDGEHEEFLERRVVSVRLGRGETVEFEFDPVPLAVPAEPREREPADDADTSESEDWHALRSERWRRRPPTATDPVDDPEDDSDRVLWSHDAYRELIRRLIAEGRPQAAVIEAAARAGGTISRQEVYVLAGYAADRTLRGFTRPPTRVTQDLLWEGAVDEGVYVPIWALYRAGVRASHFRVPPEFVAFVDR